MMELGTPQFWVAVLQIILINILLSGDNAVVIALACRNLSRRQRKYGIFWGVLGAIVLRIGLTFFAMSLLTNPSGSGFHAVRSPLERSYENSRSPNATDC